MSSAPAWHPHRPVTRGADMALTRRPSWIDARLTETTSECLRPSIHLTVGRETSPYHRGRAASQNRALCVGSPDGGRCIRVISLSEDHLGDPLPLGWEWIVDRPEVRGCHEAFHCGYPSRSRPYSVLRRPWAIGPCTVRLRSPPPSALRQHRRAWVTAELAPTHGIFPRVFSRSRLAGYRRRLACLPALEVGLRSSLKDGQSVIYAERQCGHSSMSLFIRAAPSRLAGCLVRTTEIEREQASVVGARYALATPLVRETTSHRFSGIVMAL